MIKPSNYKQTVFEWDRPPLQVLSARELFEKADEALLRQLFEDCRVEFKPNGIHGKQLGEYFSMWANSPPDGGLLVIGIRNDNKFEGCISLSGDQLNNIESTGHDYCPDAAYETKRIHIHRDDDGGNDFVVLFYVKYHPSKVVKTTDGKIYIRRANTIRQLKNADEIRQLQAQKGEVQFESEPCNLSYPKDFDGAAISDFIAAVRVKKGWSSSHSQEDILGLLHLGSFENGNFAPNIACMLLFAKDPRNTLPGCRIRFLRFQGEAEGVGERWNAVKDDFVDGNLPQQIQQIESILSSQLRTFSRLGKGGKFFTSKEYPEFAWYEAIVNACVHRSWGNGMKNMNIFVKMFDDHLVVESPGPFPPFVTPANIYDVHMPRNPYLMEAMYYLQFVRCAHEGTKRIKEEMLRSELPAPEFKQDEVSHALVRVTLKNNIKQRKVWVDSDVVALLGAQVAHGLTEEEKRCINFCAEYGKIGVSDAQRLTQKSWPAARALLGGLEDKGILEHVRRNDVDRDPKARFKLRSLSPKG